LRDAIVTHTGSVLTQGVLLLLLLLLLVQVFVANPHKPPAIVDILVNNRSKLLKYLEDFHTDRGEACEEGGGQALFCGLHIRDRGKADTHA
jgi:hypothetical protein